MMEPLGYLDQSGHVWPQQTALGDPYPEDQCRKCNLFGHQATDKPCLGTMTDPSFVKATAAASESIGLQYRRLINEAAVTGAAPPGQAAERWQEIRTWLEIAFAQDLDRIGEKAIQYGASDLKIMGKAMEALLPDGDKLDPQSRESAGLEMAIGFYAMGKTARLYGAWEKGQEPDEDCWFDNMVYSLMARYVREFGRWM